MPPKPILSKTDILNVAVQLVRNDGISGLNARSLAAALDCSTKPLFRIYRNMDDLKTDVIAELDNYYNSFMDRRMTEENRLLSQGIAYVEFARGEKQIFNTLFMNRTMSGSSLQDIANAEWNRPSIENAGRVTGLPIDKAERLFINFWLYSHGIATQIVSNGINISADEIEGLLATAFKQFSME